MSIGVNASARQLHQGGLVPYVAKVLQETGLDPQCLQLEVTEGGAMEDIERAIIVLNELKQMGVTIALDDFGTGHSSLSYLKRLPIDAVKIDQSFVRDLVNDEDDRVIASTIIAMAHAMGCKVIAEGVENEAQLAFLKEQGCDEYQGFLFSKAVPAQSLPALKAGDSSSAPTNRRPAH